MSKGKDFRGPRKRGFDDDGPMPSYDFRPPPRPAARPAFGGPAAAPGGGASFGAEPAGGGVSVDATVKWFKADKGFGFVELENGQGDAFLHVNALHSAGHETVPPGTKLKVIVGQGMKGAQVTRVIEVDTSTASEAPRAPRSFDSPRGGTGAPRRGAPDASQAVELSGKVKWFDDAKGFGFVASNDGGKDVFVHISVLRPAGIQSLAEGQPVSMKVVDTPKGREAVSIGLA
jgi:CspA family cold shock protein